MPYYMSCYNIPILFLVISLKERTQVKYLDRMVKIIECVPNFSEGVDTEVIILLLKTFRNLQHSWVWPVKILFYNQRHCVIVTFKV